MMSASTASLGTTVLVKMPPTLQVFVKRATSALVEPSPTRNSS